MAIVSRVALLTILGLIAVSGLHGRARFLPQAPGSCEVPASPTNLAATVDRTRLTLTWKAPSSGAPTNYSIEIGNAPGSTYLGTVDTGGTKRSFTKSLDAGIYFVRVRAANSCGASGVSPEVRVVVDRARIGVRTRPDVIVARRTATRNTYFPRVETMKNGHIVVVYYDSPDHVSRMGRISMVRSRDQGRTWSAPTVVIDGPNDERDPNIVETARGTWLVSYFESDTMKAPSSQGIFVIRSTDEGRTWSTPANVGTTLRGAATSSKIVQMDNGDLLMPVYGATPGGTDAVAAVIRSADDGLTWPPDGDATIASAPGINFVEPALGYLGRGQLLAMIRTEGGDGTAYESYSIDGGRTWPTATRTTLIAQASDLLPVVEGQSHPLVVHTWGDVSGKFGESRPTMMQIISFLEFPSTRRTDEPRPLYRGPCWSDEGYPSSVRLRDGRLFTVYYDACAGYIGGTFSTLTDPAEACDRPPAPPTNVKVVSNSSRVVSLTWTGAPDKRTLYILEAGKTSGSADVKTIEIGTQSTFSISQVDPGRYHVRIRGRNPCGTGDPSREVIVVVR